MASTGPTTRELKKEEMHETAFPSQSCRIVNVHGVDLLLRHPPCLNECIGPRSYVLEEDT